MAELHPTEESLVLQLIIGLLYPFMLLYGFHIILNGQFTPGGGFQGGCILATLFVARYVVFPVDDMDSERMHIIERLFLVLILVIPVLLLFTGVVSRYPAYRPLYLMIMDLVIGVEVAFGLGVAVLRFAFFQGVGQTWRL